MSLVKFLIVLIGTISTVAPQAVNFQCGGCQVWFFDILIPPPARATWRFLCKKYNFSPNSTIRTNSDQSAYLEEECSAIDTRNVVFPRFPREIFDSNPSLEWLNIENSAIEELKVGDFARAANLKTLVITRNRNYLVLGKDCFMGASALKNLYLNESIIYEIAPTAFYGLRQLETLDLSRNELTMITSEYFKPLTNLRQVNLNSNRIEYVDTEAFLYNKQLSHLRASSNPLKSLDLMLAHVNFTLTEFQNREFREFREFSLKSVEIDTPEPASEMKIDLYYSSPVKFYIQSNFPVDTLSVSYSEIKSIDDLPTLDSLKTLFIEHNEFDSLDGQRFFDRFRNVENIFMGYNNRSNFPQDLFAGLDSLIALNMDQNRLTTVDFPRLESLVRLSLTYNRLTEFPYADDVRNTFPVLEELYLQYNSFEPAYLEEIVRKLEAQGVKVDNGTAFTQLDRNMDKKSTILSFSL